jgi:hypothetical protein
MSVKSVCLSTLVAALLSVGAARGQVPPPNTGPYGPAPGFGQAPFGSPGSVYMQEGPATAPQGGATSIGDTGYGVPPPPQNPQPAAGLSSWITYEGPECCGPMGGNGPIMMEAYGRTGVNFALGAGVFGKALTPGWEVVGGGRTLFFNCDRDAAWTVDVNLSNTFNHTTNNPTEFSLLNIIVPTGTNPLTGQTSTARANYIPGVTTLTRLHPTSSTNFDFNAPGVSVKSLNRTGANVLGGREWYLWGKAGNCESINWRVGADIGGTWGTEKVEIRELRHRTGVYEGLDLALHTDLEFPCQCGCVFFVGARLEWDYEWSHVLQMQNNADITDVNLLFTFGARY